MGIRYRYTGQKVTDQTFYIAETLINSTENKSFCLQGYLFSLASVFNAELIADKVKSQTTEM